MAHINIYVDEDTRRKIRAAARREKSSLSKWVCKTLKRALENAWPEGYFDVLGSLSGSDLRRPDQGRFEDDAPRGKL
jgi:hypothetical protein